MDVVYPDMRAAMLSYFRRRLPDPEQAEDFVHDVFLKALAAKPPKDNEKLSAWLWAIARRALIDRYRLKSPDIAEIASDELPEHSVASREWEWCLTPLVQRLSPKYRDTLQAVDLGESTMQQLADREGCSLSAIKSRASRGREQLRDLFLSCCAHERDETPQDSTHSCC